MADNDLKYIKFIKKSLRQLKFKLEFINKNILSAEKGNEYIYSSLDIDKPFMIARFGSVELRCVDKWLKNRKYTTYNKISINEAAGVFPNDNETINKFCEIYTNSAKEIDALAVWGAGVGQRSLIDKFIPKAKLINILSLEPYMYQKPWSEILRDKKILIIHPFTDTIQKQLSVGNKLFTNSNVLPRFKKVEFVKAVQSNAGAICEFSNWFDALDYMKDEIDKKDYDIAIVGAGSYGIPLAAHIKKSGKKVIHMAGATQILFGIKGKRWECRPEYSKLMNEYWVRPSESETPKYKEKVEGGSYW